MKIRLVALVLAAALAPVRAQVSAPGAGLVSEGLCDNRIDPVGVDPDRVSFTWRLSSGSRGVRQVGYQIEVRTPARVVWDSGFVRSSASVGVAYSGPALAPAERYSWRVRVRDASGRLADAAAGYFTTALRGPADWRGAQWIGYEEMPPGQRLVPGAHGLEEASRTVRLTRPAVPLLLTRFDVRRPVRRALLFVSGLGHYEARLDGHQIGDAFLAPGWTHYDKTVLYNTHDVTGSLAPGVHALGLIVGNGFHHITPERYFKLSVAFGFPRALCLLRLVYDDGTEDAIVSGPGWKAAPSPITFTSIYGGEDYDARLEQPGWDTAAFDASAWRPAAVVSPPAGRLVPEEDYPLRAMETLSPVRETDTAAGVRLYDFGQNASGIVRVTVRGRAGQTITLTPAELLTADSRPNQRASGQPYVWTYTLRGDGVETWTPRFTYYGFRYVEVSGVSADGPQVRPKPDATSANGAAADLPIVERIEFLHTRTSAPEVGSFECSLPLFNRINDLIRWAIRSNAASVVTDCPHREKLGWLEQTHLMGEAIHFNYDIRQLYRKQVADMMDAQTRDGLVPDIAPEYVEFKDGFRDSPEWGSASVQLPWMLYRWYGDRDTLAAAYPMMTRYVEYLLSKAASSPGGLLSYGLGDWYDLGPKFPGEAQLTPKAVTATAILYQDLRTVVDAASVLGRPDDAARFGARAVDVARDFNRAFFDRRAMSWSTGSQTALAMPLTVGLAAPADEPRIFETLLRAIERDQEALTAGDVGFHYVVKALSDRGAGDVLFRMNSRDDVPGYGFQLKKGATALTESWAALEEVSNNHLMLGHLMEWFYTGLLGIRQRDDSIAYEHLVLRPQIVAGLAWAKGHYESPRGLVFSSWSRDAARVTLEFEVPANADAEIHLAAQSARQVTESGRPLTARRDLTVLPSRSADAVVVRVGSGRYRFEVRPAPSAAFDQGGTCVAPTASPGR